FKTGGEVGDLRDAILLLRIASQRLAPSDTVLGSILGNLGMALRNAAEQFNDPDALDEAIAAQRRASTLPADALARWGRRLNLAMALFARLETTGVADDIGEMRELLDQAYEEAPTIDRAAQVASNRAILERLLFDLGGDPHTLEQAVFFAEAAVARSPVGHPQRPVRLNNLGICLGARLTVHGHPEDGQRAVSALREACEAVSSSHVEAGTRAMNLGNAQLALFHVAHDRTDLKAATASLEEAAASLPPGHAYRASVLASLSQGLTARGVLEDDPNLLDRSVAIALAAVAATQRVPKVKPAALTASAVAFLERSRLCGNARDRAACLMALDAALALAPPASVDHLNLELLRVRVRALAAHADAKGAALAEILHEGRALLREMGRRFAAVGTMTALTERLSAARRELAAYALSSNDPIGALELIESGKGEALLRDARRSERVPAGLTAPEVDAYRAGIERLRALDTLLASSTSPIGLTSRAEFMVEAATLAQRITELERRDPLFASGNDLDADAVMRIAARSGCVLIYLFVGTEGPGAALIVRPDLGGGSALDTLALPHLTDRALNSLLAPRPMDVVGAKHSLAAGPDTAFDDFGWGTSALACRIDDLSPEERATAEEVWRRRIVTTLDWLDERVMAPVSRHLPRHVPPHWILMPDGRLSGLPLHACAAAHDRGARITYVPSAALLDLLLDRATGAQPVMGSSTALIVADSKDVGGFGAIEALQIADAFRGDGAQVRRGQGLAWLRRMAADSDELVICAHGRFDPMDVYRSTIELGAGSRPLSLAALYGGALKLKLGSSILLSSCETSKAGTRLAADEQVGFPAGFFLAGARFVAASLWSMSALATFMFSLAYIRYRLSGQDRTSSTLHAAEALRDMTRDELLSHLADAQKHAGRRKDLRRELRHVATQVADGPQRPFAHPVHWACFAANGI
ncbi:CHAT domain-containing protein, partial [Methylorubrum thiocyanatum]